MFYICYVLIGRNNFFYLFNFKYDFDEMKIFIVGTHRYTSIGLYNNLCLQWLKNTERRVRK